MGWFKNLFKSADELSAEIEEKVQQRIIERREHEERVRKSVEEQLLKEKMESATPWYERIVGSENAIHVAEQYRWNQAFIKDLMKKGFTGTNDIEVFTAYLNKQEQEDRDRIIEEERNKQRNSSEPWVEVVADSFDEDGRISIKLDWNDAFIKLLRGSGFRGATEEQMVQMWLSALQRDATNEDYS